VTPFATSGAPAGRLARRWRLRRPSRRLVAGAALILAAVAVAVAVTDPFGGAGPSGGVPDNGAATSLATVQRRSLSSRTLVDGTLGFAGWSSVVVPAGTSQSELRQAQQALATARASVEAAEDTLAADARALAEAQAKLAADRLKQASECRGDAAGGSGTSGDSPSSDSPSSADPSSGSSPCSSAAQAVASDEQAVSSAEQKVVTDKGELTSARATLAGARRSLAAAETSATGREGSAAYTMLPSPGKVVRRGQPLYAVDGEPTLLLYGRTTAWRAFRPGMPAGSDVVQLNANLRALGYGHAPAGDRFTAATEAAIRALQAAHGLPRTGVLLLGSVVFKPGAVRIRKVKPSVGQAVQQGSNLSVTSTRPRVAIKLDAAQQRKVDVGDPVTITLPSGRTTRGRVSFVGSVASTPSGGGSGNSSSTPTINVGVRLLDQAAAGRLDQAPVSVAITTSSVKKALVVPVNALLALAGGGYAVEIVDAAGVHRLVPVSLGLFDDGQGLVQVSGSRLRAGQRIVVPAS
jgi:peptidoglycan hydrolase-like protein with peptidoglycan-binding domain